MLYGQEKPAFIIVHLGNGESSIAGADEDQHYLRGHLPGADAAYLRDPAVQHHDLYVFLTSGYKDISPDSLSEEVTMR